MTERSWVIAFLVMLGIAGFVLLYLVDASEHEVATICIENGGEWTEADTCVRP